RVTVDGHTYDVEIEDPRARPVVARVEGDTFLVDVQSGVTRDVPSTVAPAADQVIAPADLVIAAPIPGTVVKVAVTPGKIIQRGDELLTIEAMKMFNV